MPSPWTTGTAEAGPLGRLVAIFGANRKTWRSENMGIVGVSATTGEYRFLDLPDYATQDDMGETEPSLSRTAVTSATGSVATSMESGPRRLDPRSSGTPSTTPSAARLGNTRVDTHLGPSPQDVAWTADDAWFAFGQYTKVRKDGTGPANAAPDEVMNTRTGETEALLTARKPVFDLFDTSSAAGGFVTTTLPDGWRLVTDPDHPDGRPFSLTLVPQATPLLSPDRRRVAFLRGYASSCCEPTPPFVADVLADRRASAHRVGSQPADELLGWRDESHVVVLTYGDLVVS